MQVETVGWDRLRPVPGNPRRGDVEQIRESIRVNGWWGVLICRKSGEILAGNHRYEAGRLEGLEEFPVWWVDCDDDTARRIALADNRTADLATWDDASLAAWLKDLSSLDGTGFTDLDLDLLLASLAPPEPVEVTVGGRRAGPTDVEVRVGAISFQVAADSYRAWYDSMVEEVGDDADSLAVEVRGRLGL